MSIKDSQRSPLPGSAAQRIAGQRQMDATVLCQTTRSALQDFANIMNRETVLLRAGHYEEASELSDQKARIAQEYVSLARVVQHEAERLKQQAPTDLESLQAEHEKLATQMAENLRVLATARTVTQNLLNDVAQSVNRTQTPQTYGASGQMSTPAPAGANGLSINRTL